MVANFPILLKLLYTQLALFARKLEHESDNKKILNHIY